MGYCCFHLVSLFCVVVPTFLGFQQMGGSVLQTFQEQASLNITCEASGIPIPELTIRTERQMYVSLAHLLMH